MGKGSKAPEYPTTVVNTGLFGKSKTTQYGSSFKPTNFQKELVNIAENNAGNALNEYLNPNYDSAGFRQGDEYYTNKMNNQLQNTYLNPALANNLLRGSTASDVMRGFANDLANTEYERQQDYKNQQLQKYQTAMLPYTTIYDMMTGTQGLSNSLANSIAQYNLGKYQADQANSTSGLGSLLGAVGAIGGAALGGPVGSTIGSTALGTLGSKLFIK